MMSSSNSMLVALVAAAAPERSSPNPVDFKRDHPDCNSHSHSHSHSTPTTTPTTTTGPCTFDMVHNLPDPSTGQVTRLYLRMDDPDENDDPTTTSLYEITAVQSELNDYESFAVGNLVVANGTLHTVTPVDPLFWVLWAHNPRNNNNNNNNNDQQQQQQQQSSWQPLSQLTPQYPEPVQRCLASRNEQYQHVLAEYVVDADDSDEVYYKFSVDKALEWLLAKQRAVQRVLLQQAERNSAQNNSHSNNNDGTGAFQLGFRLGDDDDDDDDGGDRSSTPSTTPDPPTIAQDRCTRQRQTTALYESIQVVGNYLTEEWKVLFLEYVQKTAPGAAATPLPAALLDGNVCWGHQEPPPNPLPAATDNNDPTNTTKTTTTTTINACADPMTTRTTTDWNAVTANERGSGKAQLPPVTKEISAGAKRLLKVNKKGLQPMSAFFSAAKKTKK